MTGTGQGKSEFILADIRNFSPRQPVKESQPGIIFSDAFGIHKFTVNISKGHIED